MSNKSPREASRGYDCKPFVITLLCPLSFILVLLSPASWFSNLISQIFIRFMRFLTPALREGIGMTTWRKNSSFEVERLRRARKENSPLNTQHSTFITILFPDSQSHISILKSQYSILYPLSLLRDSSPQRCARVSEWQHEVKTLPSKSPDFEEQEIKIHHSTLSAQHS
jgi:hypothetical protein